MALTKGIRGQAEAGLPRASQRAILTIVVRVGVVLLVTSMLVFGVAIQRRAVAPPQLDVRFGRSHLVAYATHTPECARYITSCPPELITLPTRDYYVIWVLNRTGQPAAADERETGRRILKLPLGQP